MTRCGRCNFPQSAPVLHPRHRELCDRCAGILGVTRQDDVRAGVDFYLASDPCGAVVKSIVGILSAAVESDMEQRRRWA